MPTVEERLSLIENRINTFLAKANQLQDLFNKLRERHEHFLKDYQKERELIKSKLRAYGRK